MNFLLLNALLKSLGSGVQFYGACDPAMGKSIFTGDYSAIIILACKGGFSYVIVADIARKAPDRLTKDIIAYAKRYQFNKFIIEANNFQELVVQSLEKEAINSWVSLPIERVHNTSRKTDRIFSLYEWVPARYSVWLPALSCTSKRFASSLGIRAATAQSTSGYPSLRRLPICAFNTVVSTRTPRSRKESLLQMRTATSDPAVKLLLASPLAGAVTLPCATTTGWTHTLSM